ncbi:hypothetical protein K438DRAFT_1788953 [Mycena galopus ATCC 62051]|nr:hypothetical protein K438DRAFT_1788953 [Mycena galopus ATCC 62051]
MHFPLTLLPFFVTLAGSVVAAPHGMETAAPVLIAAPSSKASFGGLQVVRGPVVGARVSTISTAGATNATTSANNGTATVSKTKTPTVTVTVTETATSTASAKSKASQAKDAKEKAAKEKAAKAKAKAAQVKASQAAKASSAAAVQSSKAAISQQKCKQATLANGDCVGFAVGATRFLSATESTFSFSRDLSLLVAIGSRLTDCSLYFNALL